MAKVMKYFCVAGSTVVLVLIFGAVAATAFLGFDEPALIVFAKRMDGLILFAPALFAAVLASLKYHAANRRGVRVPIFSTALFYLLVRIEDETLVRSYLGLQLNGSGNPVESLLLHSLLAVPVLIRIILIDKQTVGIEDVATEVGNVLGGLRGAPKNCTDAASDTLAATHGMASMIWRGHASLSQLDQLKNNLTHARQSMRILPRSVPEALKKAFPKFVDLSSFDKNDRLAFVLQIIDHVVRERDYLTLESVPAVMLNKKGYDDLLSWTRREGKILEAVAKIATGSDD